VIDGESIPYIYGPRLRASGVKLRADAGTVVSPARVTGMKKLLLFCAALLLSAPLLRAQSGIEISLKNNSPREVRTKERLSKLLRQYDLSKWIRTRKVLIFIYEVSTRVIERAREAREGAGRIHQILRRAE
jgi:hypothetical protein